MEKRIREPQQKRSVEKKNKIIQAGFALFSEKGYHSTNTMEIAHSAGVSTGTVYSYFKDKKAIFLAGLKYFSDNTTARLFQVFENITPPIRLDEIVKQIVDASLQTHFATKAAHEEMMAMSYQDADVHRLITELEERCVHEFAEMVQQLGISLEHVREKVLIAYHLIEEYCHEAVYTHHSFIDYGVMKQEIIRTVVGLLQEEAKPGE